MKIIPVESGIILTNGYLVIDETTNKAALIDAPQDSGDLLSEYLTVNNLKLEAIILTHSHWDHTADAPKIRRETGAGIYLHENDEYRLVDPKKYSVLILDFELESAKPDYYLNHNDSITVGNLKFEIMHTPGHTEGSVSVIMPDEKVVFTGDTLFYGSIGRTDLPGGNYDSILISVANRLMTLSDDFEVFSGHGPKTTIGRERSSNPFIINNLKI